VPSQSQSASRAKAPETSIEAIQQILRELRDGLRIVQPIYVTPRENCISFSPAASIALPAVGATAPILAATLQVPQGKNGVIWEIANACTSGLFTDGSGQLVWQITIDNYYARNYQNIVSSLGLPSAPRKLSGPIFLKEGQYFNLSVTNVSLPVGPGTKVVGLLGGWFYPKNEGDKK
jgi:hypothetical protein